MTLKAATLYQPWAGAMALELKKNETRGRRCSYRGELAIHAGFGTSRGVLEGPALEAWTVARRAYGILGQNGAEAMMRVRGAILCVVDLWACVPAEDVLTGGVMNPTMQQIGTTERALGDYSPGRFALLTRNLRVLRKPVPCRGFQAMPWTVPPDVEVEVRRQLS